MKDVFELEPRTVIGRDDSYIISYPYLLSYFAEKGTLGAADLVRGAHMVYGWMPTILSLHPDAHALGLEGGAQLLEKARREGVLACADLESLKTLVNNSMIGASKLLHFTSPEHFAIWDTRVFSFLHEMKPYDHRVNRVSAYCGYLDLLAQMQLDGRFGAFHESINDKIGYAVSPLRALELVMYLNAPEAAEYAPLFG